MPKDNPSPSEFIEEISSYISENYLQLMIRLQIRIIADKSAWTSIFDHLNIHNSELCNTIRELFSEQKEAIKGAFEDGWITKEEFDQYTHLFTQTEQNLLQQLFKTSPNQNLFWLQNQNSVHTTEKTKERLVRIYALLDQLYSQTSELLDRLESIRDNNIPKIFDYNSLERQAAYYKKIISSNGFYFFEIEERENSNGWKLHLSVAHEQLETAYSLALPILLNKFKNFKVINRSHFQKEDFPFSGFYDSKQFTIYLEEINGALKIPLNEIETALSEIENLFKNNGISAGKKPDSDRALKYGYFSMRNSRVQSDYLSADKVGGNYNPENKENPYAPLLLERLPEHFNVEQHLNEFKMTTSPDVVPITFAFYLTFFAILNTYLTKEDYDQIISICNDNHMFRGDCLEKIFSFLADVQFRNEYNSPEQHRFVRDYLIILKWATQDHHSCVIELTDEKEVDNFFKKTAQMMNMELEKHLGEESSLREKSKENHSFSEIRNYFYQSYIIENTRSAPWWYHDESITLTDSQAKIILKAFEQLEGVFQKDIYNTDPYQNPIDPYECYAKIKKALSCHPNSKELLEQFSKLVLRFAEEGNAVSIAFMRAEENKDMFCLTEKPETQQNTGSSFRM